MPQSPKRDVAFIIIMMTIYIIMFMLIVPGCTYRAWINQAIKYGWTTGNERK